MKNTLLRAYIENLRGDNMASLSEILEILLDKIEHLEKELDRLTSNSR